MSVMKERVLESIEKQKNFFPKQNSTWLATIKNNNEVLIDSYLFKDVKFDLSAVETDVGKIVLTNAHISFYDIIDSTIINDIQKIWQNQLNNLEQAFLNFEIVFLKNTEAKESLTYSLLSTRIMNVNMSSISYSTNDPVVFVLHLQGKKLVAINNKIEE